MNIKVIGKIYGDQDGAIFGNHLFRFSPRGDCRVYAMEQIMAGSEDERIEPVAKFKLDRADEIAPHSNAVVFGNEYYAEGDEFPLLYTNIYNNYANEEDKLVGVCCVYRLTRDGASFSSELVQLIEIGFTSDRELWRSAGDVKDARPYGNFVIDKETGTYYAFVMRDADKTTRYFAFDLPKLGDGEPDEKFGVRRVRLAPSDIRSLFDVPYHNFVQGACFNDGRIFSTEGFDKNIHPAIRIIDTKKREQTFFFDFFEAGYEIEAEFIDFYNGKCIYGDARGRLFELEF